MSNKKRLDLRLLELFPERSRTQVTSLIMQGLVTVDGQVITKAGTLIDEESHIDIAEHHEQFVCRAGYKLAEALEHFAVPVAGKIALDAGLSTGGFTDCLLQAGAAKVYGVDVGYGQAHEKIRIDERVVVMERTNLRHLQELPELVDLVTLDLSFISVLKVMDAILQVCTPSASLIVLIKPQFEAERQQVGRGGIIRDPVVHAEVVERLTAGIAAYGFTCHGVIESPILGGSGNKEFLAYFTRISSA
ncbi:TlyA family RNA methyltransferase [Candidatus Dependentiae bacterium]|nr:TlyA family RNA methyltransferase [Candidatus Dependentiae bacterium]